VDELDGATIATIAVPVAVALGGATWHRVAKYRKTTQDVADSVDTLSCFLFGRPKDDHTGAPMVVGWTEKIDFTMERHGDQLDRIEGAATRAAEIVESLDALVIDERDENDA